MRPFQFAALAFLCFTSAAVIADPLISPLATARPVVARHGMIVSQEAAASRVGLDILKRGGNAVDAAVAVGFALAVTLPRAGNLGGGGFMLIYRADLNQTIAIDYRETAPAATTKDVFLDANGKADPFKSRYSGLAIGVPGTVAGLELAWRKYGSGKFSFADLIAPAIALARQGLTVDDDVADSLPLAAKALASHPSSARIYLRPDGSVPQTGDHIALDDLAATLETIAAKGAAGFYSGPVAQKIVEAVNAAGGRMTIEDLANYHAVERAAGPRDLSRLYRRLDAAALVRRGAYHRDPQHSRRLSRLPRKASIPPLRCMSWRKRKSSPTPIARLISAIPISSKSRSPASPPKLTPSTCARLLRSTAPVPPPTFALANPSAMRAIRRRISRSSIAMGMRSPTPIRSIFPTGPAWLRREPGCCSTTSSTTSPPSPAPPMFTGSWAATPMRQDPRSGRFHR